MPSGSGCPVPTAVAQELGLDASDSQFLTLLNLHGPLTPGRLAALTGLSTGGQHLDAVLARRDDDELRVIAAFLAELAPR